MTIKISTAGTALALYLLLLASQQVNALPIRQVEIEARLIVTGPTNDADLGVDWSLNDIPLPSQDPTFLLGTGDTFKALVSGSARSGAAGIGEVFGHLSLNIALEPGVQNATVKSSLQGSVNSTGNDAFGKVGFSYDCAAGFKCILSENPTAPEAGHSWVISDVLYSNTTVENGVSTPTGQTGGIETYQNLEFFSLDRQLAGTENPFALFSAIFDIGAIESTSEVTFTWEVTVVPIPAAVWLFGSALGLLGWMRRKKAH